MNKFLIGSVCVLAFAVFVALPEAQHAVSDFFTGLKQPVATLLTGILAVFAVVLAQVMFDIRQRKDHAHALELQRNEVEIQRYTKFQEQKQKCIELIGKINTEINSTEQNIAKMSLIQFQCGIPIKDSPEFKEARLESNAQDYKCQLLFTELEPLLAKYKQNYDGNFFSRYAELTAGRGDLLDSIANDVPLALRKKKAENFKKCIDTLSVDLIILSTDLQFQKDDERINEILNL